MPATQYRLSGLFSGLLIGGVELVQWANQWERQRGRAAIEWLERGWVFVAELNNGTPRGNKNTFLNIFCGRFHYFCF